MLHPTIMIKRAKFTAAHIAIALLINVASQNVHALQTNLGAGIGVEYSDNIRRVTTDQEGDFTRIGMIGFSLEEDSEPIIADVAASLRYEDFAKDTFDDRFLFALTSLAEWRIVPNRLNWTIKDDFQQLPVDSIDPSTPDNTQDSNIFSTGPDAFLRLGPVNRLELGARFKRTYFEISTTSNSKRYSAFAKWLYTPSSVRELSFNIDAERADFDAATTESDFIREDYVLAFLTRTGRSELRYEIGGTSIQRDLDDFNGLLMGIHWTWSPSHLSTFNISAQSKITDSGQVLLTAASGTDQDLLQTEQIAPDLFRERRVDLAYKREGDRVVGELSTFWIDRDYKTAPLDREITGALASMSYNLTVPVVLSADTGYRRTRVFATGERNDDLFFSAGVRYLLSRNLIIELAAGYFKRNSNIQEQSYDEIRALLGVIYGIGSIPGGSLASSR